MQVKPLAITIIVFTIIVFAADTWLANSTSTSVIAGKSQLVSVPSRQILRQADVFYEIQEPERVVQDSLEATRTVAEKIQDLTLVANIEKRLFRVNELSTIEFRIKSIDGEVVLLGTVPTDKELNRALGVVKGVKGVKSVTNKIVVQQIKPAISESSSE